MKTHFQNLSFCLICLFCFGLAIETKAQQGNRKMSLQGFLRDASGKTVPDGSQEMTFKLYTQAAGGTAEWTETQQVNVFGGVYSTHLGKLEKMDELSWGTKTYYVGVTVQGIELVPRTELTFAPYALGSPRATLADTSDFERCSGAVGDVKYSILDPDQFAKENGDCWVPLDGRTLTTADALRGKFGVRTLPNAGGLFLRGQEFDNLLDHDPSRTSASAIAELQTDDVKAHLHRANLPLSGRTSENTSEHTHGLNVTELARIGDISGTSGENGYAYPVTSTDSGGEHTHGYNGSASGNTSNTGGGDTRPKNLNLWTYVRVN